MRILLIGSNGFIARHVRSALRAEGHQVVGAARRPAPGDIPCDLRRDVTPDGANRFVEPFDAVIYGAGLLAGSASSLHAVHVAAPSAIAWACALSRKPLLHISILNLEHAPSGRYFETKRAGEAAIRQAYPGAIIVRPSVVFGQDSPATRMALMQARLPVMAIPRNTGLIVPIHVDDLADLCATLIGTVRAQGVDVDAVGAAGMTMAEYLQALRAALGYEPARVIHVPNALIRAALTAAGSLRVPTLSPALLDLTEHWHTGHPQHFLRWMRRDPRPVSEFLVQPVGIPNPEHPDAKPHPV